MLNIWEPVPPMESIPTIPEMLKSVNLIQASEWLIQNIEKYPQCAGFLGIGISVALLIDTYSNNDAVKALQKEYEDLSNTDPKIFAAEEYYLQNIFKRTNEIRNNVVNFKKWQRIRTIVKTIFSTVFGWIGYSAIDTTVKTAAFISSGIAGTSAAFDAYNWHALHKLVEHLDRTGYIAISNICLFIGSMSKE
ncbi:unnamed protein product [Adineta ricciae]|uniref:Uncharacterized protein n=1 Tax=Adineta ricciae TaxID=249248 RepID=A0A815R5U6_ADIRI|nr:unnamed protein product [Adineta ricciae]